MKALYIYYSTLHGQDQREKEYFKFHEVYFEATVLYCSQGVFDVLVKALTINLCFDSVSVFVSLDPLPF